MLDRRGCPTIQLGVAGGRFLRLEILMSVKESGLEIGWGVENSEVGTLR